MIVLRKSEDLNQVTDQEMKACIQLRLQQIEGEYIVVEAGDSVADLETASGCQILTGLFDNCQYPDDDFAPSCEVLDDHGSFYEAVWILNDDGFCVSIFIPKLEEVVTELIAMCAEFATPAAASTP